MELAPAYLMEDLKWTRERLINWARWSRSGRGGPATCFSIEGRYKRDSLLDREDEGERDPRPAMIDELDALKVYRAVLPIYGFPVRLLHTLSGSYIWRFRGESLRAYLRKNGHTGIRGRDLEALLHEAEIAAHNRISRLDRRETLTV
jgi:hypothetical protein